MAIALTCQPIWHNFSASHVTFLLLAITHASTLSEQTLQNQSNTWPHCYTHWSRCSLINKHCTTPIFTTPFSRPLYEEETQTTYHKDHTGVFSSRKEECVDRKRWQPAGCWSWIRVTVLRAHPFPSLTQEEESSKTELILISVDFLRGYWMRLCHEIVWLHCSFVRKERGRGQKQMFERTIN